MIMNLMEIQKREIEKELKESYLDYAMSVIVSRALPDARDGLKPVQRRILWTMWEEGLKSEAKFRKSATVVGSTLGRYHPHGDIAVYESLVRMAQGFSLGEPLIKGQGNFGSEAGDDPPAAQRYTECKLSKVGEEMLKDIEKDTVDFAPNYDGNRKEPTVLPCPFPQLLTNGCLGIAVGLATNIPPHNLSEVISAAIYLIDNPKTETKELIKFIPGPDFPTGGLVYVESISDIYNSGRGKITIQAKTEIEEKKENQFQIIVKELPYQTSKSNLISKIAWLAQEGKISGIKDIRDESDREGIRIVIELKSGIIPQKILNFLFSQTDLRKDFHFNMIALDQGIQPQLFSLKNILLSWLEHQKKVIVRRTKFDLDKARQRAHILEGLSKALKIIDKIIALIKKSKDRAAAEQGLIKNFRFSPAQANAILEMKLSSLAKLESKKIEEELKEKNKLIAELTSILKSPLKILSLIKNNLIALKEKHGRERRTEIVSEQAKKFQEKDFISQEQTLIIFTRNHYIKRILPVSFKSQKRGGKGLSGLELKEEDLVDQFIKVNTHDNVLFFTDKGKVFQTKAYEIPAGSRISKGKLIYNFLELSPQEKIKRILGNKAIINYKKEKKPDYLIMLSQKGIIKKTDLAEFQNIRKNGLKAFNVKKDDSLGWADLCSENDELLIVTKKGLAIRFKQKELRPMKRQAAGCRALKLGKDDLVAGMSVIKPGEEKENLLIATANGFAKQTPVKSYRLQKRGGKGIKAAKINEKTGSIVNCILIKQEFEDVLFISDKGQILKTKLKNIRKCGRVSQGIKAMNLSKGDKLKGIICL